MKKILIQVLVIMLLFNFIYSNFSYAMPAITPSDSTAVYSEETFNNQNNNGTTSLQERSSGVDIANTKSTSGAIIGILSALIDVVPLMFNKIMNLVAEHGGYINLNMSISGVTEDDFKWVTIEKILFGNYYIFNANFFKDSSDLEVRTKDNNIPTPGGLTTTLDTLRNTINLWYYIMRLISMVLGLLTLIYIGIRMAVSTIASDRAKYKKMLVGWVQSIMIIVILPYVMIIFNYVAAILMNIIVALKNAFVAAGEKSFETEIITDIYKQLSMQGGMVLAAYSIEFWLLVWAEFRFFMMYMRRLFAIGFLTVIAPLITITYSIDKAGDGRAQAFASWMREYSINVLIQPLQALLYLIFIYSANEIAKVAPMVGIIFLMALTRAEKIFKEIFNLRNLSSMRTITLFKKK